MSKQHIDPEEIHTNYERPDYTAWFCIAMAIAMPVMLVVSVIMQTHS